MASITLGSVTLNIPLKYRHTPTKFETYDRTLDGSLVVNYAVNSDDTAINKYTFTINGITQSERLSIREEALKTTGITYVDNVVIPERLTATGSTSTGSLSLLRGIGSTSTLTATLAGSTMTVTYNSTGSPSTGEINFTTTGAITIGTTSTGILAVNYVPSYTVHIINDEHIMEYTDTNGNQVSSYSITLEEM